jgi:hypothetical protein
VDLEHLKDAFWAVVVDCLTRFHGYALPLAREEALALRDRVEAPMYRDLPSFGYDAELIYHSEPFYLACDIAGRQLPLEQFAAVYSVIRDQRYAVGERAALAGGMGTRTVRSGLPSQV